MKKITFLLSFLLFTFLSLNSFSQTSITNNPFGPNVKSSSTSMGKSFATTAQEGFIKNIQVSPRNPISSTLSIYSDPGVDGALLHTQAFTTLSLSDFYEDFDDEAASNGKTNYTTDTGLIFTGSGTNFWAGAFTVGGHLFDKFVYGVQGYNNVLKFTHTSGKSFRQFSGDFYYGTGSSSDHGFITFYYKGLQVGGAIQVEENEYIRLNTTAKIDEIRASSVGFGHFYIDDFEFSIFPVSTTDASAITGVSATLGGDIASDIENPVTDRGIVYAIKATNSDPKIGGTSVIKVMVGTGTGVFDESISSLTSETQYSYAAFVTTIDGTFYGAVKTFTTPDATPPTLTSSAPTDGATGITTSSNIVLTFDENIAFGTGKIEVIDVTDGSNSFTIDAASPGGQASISGAVLTINPNTSMDDSSNYAIQIAATAIHDAIGNSYAGITNNTTLDFTTADETNPTLNSSSPSDGASAVVTSSNIVLTFDENIAFGSGNIQVIDVTDGSNSFTIDAASPGGQASISGAVLTINTNSNLDDNSNYAVQIAATAIDDGSGNSYAGIINNTTLDFTTAENTTVTLSLSGSPLAENAGVATITATLNAVSSQTVTVTINPSGTATGSGEDYTLSSSTITIAAGATSGTATVTGVDDAIYEGNETVIIDITGVANGSESGTQQVTATITDNESAPTVSLSISGSPLAENGGVATITATLDNASSQTNLI